MLDLHACFSSSYAQARAQFLQEVSTAAQDVSAQEFTLQTRLHPLRGADGEELALDVARFGAPDAKKVLIISSACHGVEGYCGSGVQVHALRERGLLQQAREQGVTLLFLHALNPWGFSWKRRVTHENVDLNRNFQDFNAPLPDNPAYAQLHEILLPPEWPPTEGNQAALQDFIAREGFPALQAAVSGGQYAFADGMFYGGQTATWSNQQVRAVLREHAAQALHLAWVDLHTGLGASGVGERIFAGSEGDQASLARARAWWGQNGVGVTSIFDGSSTSAKLTGMMWLAAYQECPRASYTGIALEYGTLPVLEMLGALRADHWLANHPQAAPALAQAIRAAMFAAFYTDTDAWRNSIIEQAQLVLAQAVQGLGAV